MNLEILLRVVIVALAAYRVSRMIALEDGPFDLFSRFRSKFDKPKGVPLNWIERGVSCPLCVGIYISIGMYFLSGWDVVNLVVFILAVAGLQTFLQRSER